MFYEKPLINMPLSCGIIRLQRYFHVRSVVELLQFDPELLQFDPSPASPLLGLLQYGICSVINSST